MAVLLRVLAAKIDREPQEQPANKTDAEVKGVETRQWVAKRSGDRTNKAQELLRGVAALGHAPGLA